MATPLFIGGGEIAQSVWFELKGLGVKSPSVLQGVLQLVGNTINGAPGDLETAFEHAYPKNVFGITQAKCKDIVRGLFMQLHAQVKQFLLTNVPAVRNVSTVTLGFQAGSITVQL